VDELDHRGGEDRRLADGAAPAGGLPLVPRRCRPTSPTSPPDDTKMSPISVSTSPRASATGAWNGSGVVVAWFDIRSVCRRRSLTIAYRSPNEAAV
jgi:hypothetical protein